LNAPLPASRAWVCIRPVYKAPFSDVCGQYNKGKFVLQGV